MSEDVSIQALKAMISAELDLIERIEFHSAEISQIHDQATQLQQFVFAASRHGLAARMTEALGQLKEGLEGIYAGVNAFRDTANEYTSAL